VQVRHTAPRAAGTFRQANGPAAPNPPLPRPPATDSRRPPDPTSRMGPAKWRVPHVRFLRSAPHGAAWHFDAKGDQRMKYKIKSFRTWRKRSSLDIVYYRLWSACQNGV